jgi:DinB superfamily
MTARAKKRGGDAETELLLEFVDQAFNRKGWHGTTLRGALRGVSHTEALWRPGSGRHNIWELTLHAAYWKYIVRRRIVGGGAEPFERKPSNWPAIPEPATASTWKRDVLLLDMAHRQLRNSIQSLAPADLARLSPKGVWTLAEEIHGIAAHDLYHTGQIQLIKRLMR